MNDYRHPRPLSVLHEGADDFQLRESLRAQARALEGAARQLTQAADALPTDLCLVFSAYTTPALELLTRAFLQATDQLKRRDAPGTTTTAPGGST